MKTKSIAVLLLSVFTGCSADTPAVSTNVDASIPYADRFAPLIGEWASEGELALIVERSGDEIFVRNPVNDTWRFEVSNPSTEGTSISFTQKSFLIDGTAHAFNGVPCDTIIAPVDGDPDGLAYTITSEHTPDGASDIMRRIPDGG